MELSRSALDAFFAALAERAPCRMKLILTGGAESLLFGSTRPTRDLDFEVAPLGMIEEQGRQWPAIETALAEASRVSGVVVQYSADIDRWSSITMPYYRRHTRLYRRYGRVFVHLLEPAYWAVPKLARYVDSDIEDLMAVLSAQQVDPEQLARLCGRALRASPRSPALFSFRQHVEDFLRTHGPAVWGADLDAEAAVRAFRRAAGIRL